MAIFAELADKGLCGCVKPKKLRNSEYKVCLNRGTMVHIE